MGGAASGGDAATTSEAEPPATASTPRSAEFIERPENRSIPINFKSDIPPYTISMPKMQYIGSVSPLSVLDVGVSYGQFVAFNVLPFQIPGEPVEINVMLKNIGDTPDTFHIDFDSNASGQRSFTGVRSELFTLAPGEAKWILTFIEDMPGVDRTYWGRSFHGDIEDELSVGKTVEVLTQMPTTLTCAISPSHVAKGGTYVQSGRLTRNDTLAGVPGQYVIIERLEAGFWTRVVAANVVTDAQGNYSSPVVAPSPATTPASYSVRSEFMGSAVLGASLSYSRSLVTNGLSLLLENGLVLGGASLGLGGLASLSRKKSYVVPAAVGGLILGAVVQRLRGKL